MNKRILFLILALGLMLFNPVYSVEDEPEVENTKSLPYNYLDTERIPIYLSITDEISTKDGLIDGQELEFRAQKDVIYKNHTILKKGDIVKGHLEMVVTAGMNGFPAEIVVDNFDIPNIKQSQLISNYVKKGQNRCLWVFPLKWSLTFIPFVGSLTNLIMGGHAKIKTTDTITLYYYPNWR